MFKQTSKQMQHSSWPESGRHLWLFSSRLSKHTLHTLQWNDLSLWILSEAKKIDSAWKTTEWISNTTLVPGAG